MIGMNVDNGRGETVMRRTVMQVKDLKKLVEGWDDEALVLLSSDNEGNQVSPIICEPSYADYIEFENVRENTVRCLDGLIYVTWADGSRGLENKKAVVLYPIF